MRVLQGRLHAFLVVQLLVHGVFGLVRAGLDADVDAVSPGKGAEEADAEGEAWCEHERSECEGGRERGA